MGIVDLEKCSLCKKGSLVKKGEQNVGRTTYSIFKCSNEKCNHEVARSAK